MGPFATDDILTASRRFRGIADMAGPAGCPAQSRLTSGQPNGRPPSKRACTGQGSAQLFLILRPPALILIAAPFSSRLSRYKRLFEDATIYAGAVGCVLANRLSEAQSHSSMGQTKIVRYADSADRFSIIPL